MALQTFTPPVPPSPGTRDRPALKLKKVEFGDGYSQITRDGLNHRKRVLTLSWKMLTPAQANTILTFLETHAGDTSFYYTPSDEATPVKWRCETWEHERLNNGLRAISCTFEQSFSLEV